MTDLESRRDRPGIVFLSHAVDRSGPPVYLLHLLRWMRDHTDTPTRVVSLDGGDLADEFRALTQLDVVGEPLPPRRSWGGRRRRDPWRRHPAGGPDPGWLVYVNTAWSVRALHHLPDRTGPLVAHVHELEVGLDYHLPAPDRQVLLQADHFVAASQAVADNLADRWAVPAPSIHVHHEMIDTAAPARVSDDDVRALRASIGVVDDAVVVGTTAVVNWRKAPDLFLELAATTIRRDPGLDSHFAWVGVDQRAPEVAALRRDARRAGIADRFHLVPVSDRPEAWMRAFDLFVLPAREDAYPLAALEAAAAGRPVICFEAGGMPEFVRDGAGAVVDYPDVGAMAAVVSALGTDGDRRAELGRTARERVAERHDVSVAAPRLWREVAPWIPQP